MHLATECYLKFLDLWRQAAGKQIMIVDQHGYKPSVLMGIPPDGFSEISKQNSSGW